MPVQRYVAQHGLQIHPSEFIIVTRRTHTGRLECEFLRNLDTERKKSERKKKRLTSTFQLRSTLPCFILFLSADSLPFSPHDSIFLLSISTVRLCSPPPPPPLPSVPPVLFLSPKNKNKAADRTLPRSLCLPAPFYSVVKVKRQVDLCRPPPSSLSPSRADSIPFTSH